MIITNIAADLFLLKQTGTQILSSVGGMSYGPGADDGFLTRIERITKRAHARLFVCFKVKSVSLRFGASARS
jgi:hypothetical protein